MRAVAVNSCNAGVAFASGQRQSCVALGRLDVDSRSIGDQGRHNCSVAVVCAHGQCCGPLVVLAVKLCPGIDKGCCDGVAPRLRSSNQRCVALGTFDVDSRPCSNEGCRDVGVAFAQARAGRPLAALFVSQNSSFGRSPF